MELEQGKNVDFWRDMTTITEDEISKLRKLEASGKGPGRTPFTLSLSNGFSPDMILFFFFLLLIYPFISQVIVVRASIQL